MAKRMSKKLRPAPKVLAPEVVLRLGALTLEAEKSDAVEALIADQREAYERCGKDDLIEALLARDRLLGEQGRTIADGRMLSRLTRELVRAALYSAGGRPDVGAVQQALEKFGVEPTDLRQLALHGSTLGPLEAPEVVAGALVSGERKSR